ncbi:MAG: pyridoxamine 5'-phosphate oxidase [Planctomycetota bacterium]
MASTQDERSQKEQATASASPLDAVHAYSTTHGEPLPDALPAEPFSTLHAWLDEATRRKLQPNPNAMALATASANGHPSVRIVLCRTIDVERGALWFYTNYDSRKGRELAANPRAAVVFHWDAVERQARVEGVVERLSDADNDAYFSSRRWEKRAGAWASDQSRPIESRPALLDKVERSLRRFDIDPADPPPADADLDIPRPPHWGGFRLVADAAELWVGSPARIHDRARWTRPTPDAPWTATRLQP